LVILKQMSECKLRFFISEFQTEEEAMKYLQDFKFKEINSNLIFKSLNYIKKTFGLTQEKYFVNDKCLIEMKIEKSKR